MLPHAWLPLGSISHLDQPLDSLGLQPTRNPRTVEQNRDLSAELKCVCVSGEAGDEAAGRNCLPVRNESSGAAHAWWFIACG